jgi:hypothetical protein
MVRKASDELRRDTIAAVAMLAAVVFVYWLIHVAF